MTDIYKSLAQSKIFLSPTQLMRGQLGVVPICSACWDQNVNAAAQRHQGPSTVVTVPSSWALRVTHVPGPADPESPAKAVPVSRVCKCWKAAGSRADGRLKGKARLCAHFRE